MFAERRNYDVKDICKYADNREFSDVLIFNEDKKKINGLVHVHLPDGPTVRWAIISKNARARMSNLFYLADRMRLDGLLRACLP